MGLSLAPGAGIEVLPGVVGIRDIGGKRRFCVKNGEKLVIVGCSGSGGPAAMLAKKLMPEVDVTVIRKEEFFIVR